MAFRQSRIASYPPASRSSPAPQVFVNLLSNALKYTRKCPGAKIEIGAQKDGSEWVYLSRITASDSI